MNEQVTVELDAETLAAARRAGLNLSELLTHAVRRYLPQSASEQAETAQKWREENREAIDAYNRIIEEDGYVFSDGVRTF